MSYACMTHEFRIHQCCSSSSSALFYTVSPTLFHAVTFCSDVVLVWQGKFLEVRRAKPIGSDDDAASSSMLMSPSSVGAGSPAGTAVCLSFGPIEKYFMFSVTLACARRTGAAVRVERRRASRSDTRAASQAFERMHNTLSHRVKS